MSELLKLPPADLQEIYTGLAQRLKRTANALEKDVWVVWTLGALFEMPGRLPMAFKGGTSLSKVFKAIQRFPEDIDVTRDYHSFPTKYGLMEPPFRAGSHAHFSRLRDLRADAIVVQSRHLDVRSQPPAARLARTGERSQISALPPDRRAP